MKPFAIAATLAATLTLAACGNAPEQPAETNTSTPAAQSEPAPVVETPAPAPAVDPAPSEAPAVTLEVPANTMVPGTGMTVEQAVDQVQQQVNQLQLTDAEKLQAVAEARKSAEDAARQSGLGEDQVKQAGDAAERAARIMFGIR